VRAQEVVRVLHPHAYAWFNVLEGGWMIWDGEHHGYHASMIGEALTEEEAWQNAATNMLTKALS
jgi:hypothetical protein